MYAAFLIATAREGPWVVHVEGRARDTRLRAFFPGNVWLQEAWVGYETAMADSLGHLAVKAGKLYRRVGRFWDGSFFGNVHYFDGLKLNPQFGVEATAESSGRLRLGATVQYVLDSDRVSGALPGRDFETLEGTRERDGVFARFTAASGPVTLGVSGGAAGIERGREGADEGEEFFRAPILALDLDLALGDLHAYVEWTRRWSDDVPVVDRAAVPGSRAEWWLAGTQLPLGPVSLRYNFSRGEYPEAGRSDWIHQPGLTARLADRVRALAEFDLWLSNAADADGSLVTDRSANVVLLITF